MATILFYVHIPHMFWPRTKSGFLFHPSRQPSSLCLCGTSRFFSLSSQIRKKKTKKANLIVQSDFGWLGWSNPVRNVTHLTVDREAQWRWKIKIYRRRRRSKSFGHHHTDRPLVMSKSHIMLTLLLVCVAINRPSRGAYYLWSAGKEFERGSNGERDGTDSKPRRKEKIRKERKKTEKSRDFFGRGEDEEEEWLYTTRMWIGNGCQD